MNANSKLPEYVDPEDDLPYNWHLIDDPRINPTPDPINIDPTNNLTWAQEHAHSEGYWPDGTGYRPDEY